MISLKVCPDLKVDTIPIETVLHLSTLQVFLLNALVDLAPTTVDFSQ